MEILNLLAETILEERRIGNRFYRKIFSEFLKEMNADSGSIYVYDKKNKKFILKIHHNLKKLIKEIRLGERIVGWTGKTKKPLILNNGLVNTPFKNLGTRKEIISAIIFPIKLSKNDDVVGVICLNRTKTKNKFNKLDLEKLKKVENVLGISIKFNELYKNLSDEKEESKRLAEERTNLLLYFSHEILNFIFFLKSIANSIVNENIKDFISKKINYVSKLIENSNIMMKMKVWKEKLAMEVGNLLESLVIEYSNQIYLANKKINLQKENKIFINYSENYEVILRNLIENCIAYTKDIVDIKLKRMGNWCKIEISDNGLGISDEILKIIKKKKFTFEKKGLGLRIVDRLVKIEKGKWFIKSIKNQGTTFILYFPIFKWKVFSKRYINREIEFAKRNNKKLIIFEVINLNMESLRKEIIKRIGYDFIIFEEKVLLRNIEKVENILKEIEEIVDKLNGKIQKLEIYP